MAAITQPDLLWFLPEIVSDTASSNGGLMSETQAVTGSKNNVWENVSADDRSAGIITWRKIFGSPRNTSGDGLDNVIAWNHAPTSADDYILVYPGTKTDVESGVVTTRAYGSAILKTTASIGVTSLVVTVENASMTGIFAVGDKVVLSMKASPELVSGDAEVVLLHASTAPSVSGLDITLTLAAATTIALTAGVAVVSSCVPVGDIEATHGTITKSSSGGSFDETTYAPVFSNKGTMDETLTCTFSNSGANVSITGSRSGGHGSFPISADIELTHPTNSAPLITLPTGFFDNGFADLDTVTIPTVACNFSIWLKRVVPALSDTLAGNENISAYRGEGA